MSSSSVTVAEEIHRELPADDIEAFLAACDYRPAYTCLDCETPGDVRTSATSLVVFLDPARPGHGVARLSHQRCARSGLRPWSEFLALDVRRAIGGTYRTGCGMWVDYADLDGGRLPMLIVELGETDIDVAKQPDGSFSVVDKALAILRGDGFTAYQPPGTPPQLPGWTLHVTDDGVVRGISAPASSPLAPTGWFIHELDGATERGTSKPGNEFPWVAPWIDLLRRVRTVIVAVVPPSTLLPPQIADPDLQHRLVAAISSVLLAASQHDSGRPSLHPRFAAAVTAESVVAASTAVEIY